ncbi:interferon-induced GTP-binding protein Mx [Cucurbitaria berberidis CBS 394.84]|uniref:Interferon-induced GTP-binding protein Mx n=1 Tax=Cucurbitaria berberidis CBS 394.84 TaxID=1168544 RepID=A0A9P4GRA7_9PLEO|nr:interferon-induced GTP-binding protein Mx [Cucurbitaria berberidis CBS 394.84]KAF1850290.1 interferon-induced GTP-binding protein Mx [Cucurbitaria berberidis CBS 394.84]
MHLAEQDTRLPQSHPPAAGEIDPLGVHVKEAIATINRLESLGLQRLKIPLPKCIVLGEQSTGKSSVIEAISGIKTPRSTGTCTRCPLFIKLEPSGDPLAGWSASVSLRREFAWDGKTGRGFERRFPGWAQLSQPTIVQFSVTDNPKDLEDIIARAQLATISPMVDHKEFLRPSIASLNDHHRCEFSPNIVCISITHPSLPALSFYDLPGIIGQAESASSQFLVKFVRDLVVEYVKDPEALILVTCSLENDIANSTAGGIARELRATDRCIGVLTKPDRLPPGSRHDSLRDILDQKRFALGHGYFVVKNLGQDELDAGLSHYDARLREQQFFEGEPWATTFKHYESRFGTLNLQRFLSEKLAEQITKKLPVIHSEIEVRLRGVETDLQQFPEPPTHNASRIIFDILLEFSQHVRRELEAEFPCKVWRNNWAALQNDFFDALVSMKPTMATSGNRDVGIYYDTLGSQPGRSMDESIIIDDDEDDQDVHMDDTPETPSKKRKVEGTPGPTPSKTPLRRLGLPNPKDTKMPRDFSDLRKVFRLDGVAQHLDETSKSRVPGQIEPRVIYGMMLETLEHWDRPLNDFFNALEQQLRTQVKALFREHFSKWEGSDLFDSAWKIVEEMLNLNFHQQRTTMADESLNDEREGPYIFHNDIFEREKDAILEHYHQARSKTRFNLYRRERQQRTGKAMSPQEEERLKKDTDFKLVLAKEPYHVELGVIAQVSTYYIIAARRFHDAVCMRIESKFYKQLRSQLRDELENGLGLNDGSEGHRNAIRLLAEPPHREQKRKELLGMKNSFLQGQQILKDLEQRKYGEDAS